MIDILVYNTNKTLCINKFIRLCFIHIYIGCHIIIVIQQL